MKSRLRWSQRVRRDLGAIGRYIARDDPDAARRWVGRLREKARSAAELPGMGRRVPELERDDIREVLLRSYRILYRVLDEEIHILTVVEGHQQLPCSSIPDDER